jgi:hypothetical protein
MSKFLLLCLAACLCLGQTHAQFQLLSSSTSFDEPEEGFCKIITTKEGGTVYVHVTHKEGINIRVYDATHTQKVVKNIMPGYGKLKGGDVIGAYEINSKIALFIRDYEDKTPTLYRIVIDEHTGSLVEEKEIGTLKKMDLGKGYAMVFAKIPMPEFYVRKDPESDNYAVALFNSFASDRNERIELVHYNKDHKEISRAFYQSPNDEYKYLTFQDMTVMGDKEVVALAVGMNTRSSGGDQNGSLLTGTLTAGSKSLELTKLNYPGAAQIDGALVRYNKVTDEYILLSVRPVKGSKSGEYKAYRTILKKGNNSPVTTMLSSASLNRIANRHFEKKDQFLAIPQNLYVNDDGGYTIIFEENMMKSYTTNDFMGSNGGFGGARFSRTTTRNTFFLNDIGIISYDKDGTENGAFYIPKSQKVYSLPDMMYYSYREESAVGLSWGIQYKSFYYLNGKNQNYVFINDIEKNQEKIDDKKRVTTIQGLEDCEAYSFAISKGAEMPKRQLIFTDKDSKKEKDIALFTVSAYDREHNIFTTLKRERTGRDKSVKVVWMQPQ